MGPFCVSREVLWSTKPGSLSEGLLEEDSQTTAVGSEQELSDGSHHSPESAWADPVKVFGVGEHIEPTLEYPSEARQVERFFRCLQSACHNGGKEKQMDGINSLFSCQGSKLHGINCRPCAWFWKSTGCQNGQDCKHCHLCDSGEIQRRRKMKQSMMRRGLLS